MQWAGGGVSKKPDPVLTPGGGCIVRMPHEKAVSFPYGRLRGIQAAMRRVSEEI
jgi:hypothetical protein